MDRASKAADRVHVYQTERSGKLLDTFTQKPYTQSGLDNYEYKGVMYPGYVYHTNIQVVYILLDVPLFKGKA